MGKIILKNKILKIKQNDKFYSKRDNTALTPLSDDQNHYAETPQGANREIKESLLVKFSLSLLGFGFKYFGQIGFNSCLILDFGLYIKVFGLELVGFAYLCQIR